MVLRAQTDFFDFTAKMTRYYGKNGVDRDIITFLIGNPCFQNLLENWCRKMVLRAQTEFFDSSDLDVSDRDIIA